MFNKLKARTRILKGFHILYDISIPYNGHKGQVVFIMSSVGTISGLTGSIDLDSIFLGISRYRLPFPLLRKYLVRKEVGRIY